MSFKRGIASVVVAGAIVAVAVGSGMALWLSGSQSDIKTRQMKLKQNMIMRAKIDYDHAKHLVNDSLWLGGQWAAWEQGTKNALWEKNKIPSWPKVKSNFTENITDSVLYYLGELEKASEKSSWGFISNIDTSFNVKKRVEDQNFRVNISGGINSYYKNLSVNLHDNFRFKRKFELRYGLLYKKAKNEMVTGIEDEISNDIPSSVNCRKKWNSLCGNCPPITTIRNDLRNKCKGNYKDKIKSEIEGIDISGDISLESVEIRRLQGSFSISNQCYDSSECCDYCDCSNWNGTASPPYCIDCGICAVYDIDYPDDSEDVSSCGCDQYRKKSNGTFSGQSFVVEFELEDPQSEILTNSGRKSLKFIRRYKTTIS